MAVAGQQLAVGLIQPGELGHARDAISHALLVEAGQSAAEFIHGGDPW